MVVRGSAWCCRWPGGSADCAPRRDAVKIIRQPGRIPRELRAVEGVLEAAEKGDAVREAAPAARMVAEEAAVVAWTVKPGQRIGPHTLPSGQDTLMVLAGQGEYQVDSAGRTKRVQAGDVVVAPKGAVHGVLNTGVEPLIIVSVVSPALSGYEPV